MGHIDEQGKDVTGDHDTGSVRTEIIEPFAIVYEALLDDVRISDRAVRLWAIIRRYEGGDRLAWPGRATLADRLGVSTDTIDRCIRELENAGWLRVQRRGESGQTSQYVTLNPTQTSSARMTGRATAARTTGQATADKTDDRDYPRERAGAARLRGVLRSLENAFATVDAVHMPGAPPRRRVVGDRKRMAQSVLDLTPKGWTDDDWRFVAVGYAALYGPGGGEPYWNGRAGFMTLAGRDGSMLDHHRQAGHAAMAGVPVVRRRETAGERRSRERLEAFDRIIAEEEEQAARGVR
jgi:DNA-binding transcriptional regulator YhcF (GntR family)